MSPRRVDVDARRQEVLRAAVRVFARKGFAATRVEDVAAEAGIGKGSVYLSFASREALLQAALADLTAQAEQMMAAARTGSGAPLDRLAALVRTAVGAALQEPELARVLLDLWSLGRSGVDVPLDMAGLYAGYRAVVADLLADAAAEGTARPDAGPDDATVIVGAIEGCLLQWVIDPRLPVDRLAESVVAVCLDGVRRRERP
jgi:AcrR family transcriptional regulator